MGKLITINKKLSFAEFKAETFGFWEDKLELDRHLIESRRCPKCRLSLIYKGFSNVHEYRAYGVCEECDFAELFWIEKVEISGARKVEARA